MNDFKFDETNAVVKQTYDAKVFDKDGEYEVRYALGNASEWSRDTLPRVISQERANRMRDMLLEELNHPDELRDRVHEYREQLNTTHKMQEEKDEALAAALTAQVRDTMGHGFYDVQLGDAFVIAHRVGDWNQTVRYYTAVQTAGGLDVGVHGESSAARALKSAKEQHGGRIMLVRGDQLVASRKGAKSSAPKREYVEKFQVYSAKHRCGAAYKDLAVRLDQRGNVSYRRSALDMAALTPLRFDTREEAQAWIDKNSVLNPIAGRAQFVIGTVKVPVKKAKS